MGNESENKSKLNNEYITFESIQETFSITDPDLFKKYLQEVFVDLSTKGNNSKIKYLSRLTFYDYIKLPILISEKLFNSFSSSKSKEGLTEDEFVSAFFKLYLGSFQDTTKIIFNLLDFDKDGIIKKADVKLILSYLPLNDVSKSMEKSFEFSKDILDFQMKSLVEIDDIVKKTFQKYGNKMNFEQFKDTVQNQKSDVYLQLILYFYQKKPFSSKNIESLKIKYSEKEDEEHKKKMKLYNSKKSKAGIIKIKNPNQMSMFSPSRKFFRKRLSLSLSMMNLTDEQNYLNKTLSKSTNNNILNDSSGLIHKDIDIKKSTITMKSSVISTQSESDIPIPEGSDMKNIENGLSQSDKNISVKLNNEGILDEDNKDNLNNIKEMIDNSKDSYSSPSQYLQEKSPFNSLLSINKSVNNEINLLPINEERSENDEDKRYDNNSDEEENEVHYENWVYKLTENKCLKKFYLVLLNKDIYYYRDKEKIKFLGMHNLSGCFLQESGENESIFIENQTFYIFEINFHNKSKIRKYYTPNLDVCKKFVKKVKEAIEYIKFEDHYELKEELGKGKFGVVNLGIHKKTQQKVAVKIINKDSIKSIEDKELVKVEIGILKLCHHPNVVRLLDHIENLDYIFIVTEYIEGGTLGQYLKKNNFNFTEQQAANMIYQIASGIKYLHNYGIVHRDLKPDNIMITEPNEKGILKIMDFGLSKIVSSQEKMIDGYGTLSYVAPEVLLRAPYNKEVDIWSLGIILYYILCGHLPFKGRKEVIIAEKIVSDDLEFDEDEWENRTKKVKDLISSCLKKEPEERITINEFLNHPWIKKNLKEKLSS